MSKLKEALPKSPTSRIMSFVGNSPSEVFILREAQRGPAGGRDVGSLSAIRGCVGGVPRGQPTEQSSK